MKFLLLFLTSFICYCCFSQHGHFIRVFDSNNHKIAKGHLLQVTDSSIFLTKGNNKPASEIHYLKIGHIKLRHSFGHTFAMITVFNTGLTGAVGAATAHNSSDGSFFFPKYNAIEGFGIGSALGGIQGILMGSIVGLTKGITTKRITPINGDYNNWKIAKLQLNKWLVK